MILNNLPRFIRKNQTKKTIVRYSELKKFIHLGKNGNPVAYSVITARNGCIDYSITSIKQGFMTRGHIHKKNYPEIYILLKGKAQLAVKNKEKRVFDMKAGKIYFVQGKNWHRTINKGKNTAEIITICPGGAGHIYKKG